MEARDHTQRRCGLWRSVAIAITALLMVGTGAVAATAAPTHPSGRRTQTSRPADPVPAEYQSLYDGLSANLNGYATALASTKRAGPTRPPIQGAELLSANGNRFAQLLDPRTMTGVEHELDALRRLGVRGVTLGIKLPLLLATYLPDADRYASFYASVANKARAAGMKVSVELGAPFCGTVFANCDYQWPSTIDEFAALTATQAQIVIDRVRPDYLTIVSEPSTEAALTRLADFDTPEGTDRYVRGVLDGITHRRKTEIGAGAASWLPIAYDELIVRESIDYLVTHIYPATARTGETLVSTAALAREHHKVLVVDEVGLYKTVTAPNTSGVAQSEDAFRLDRFGFFAPLDERFLATTRAWARKAGVVYESAFWSGQLFSYLTWTPELDALGYRRLAVRANQAVVAAMDTGAVTAGGRAWAR